MIRETIYFLFGVLVSATHYHLTLSNFRDGLSGGQRVCARIDRLIFPGTYLYSIDDILMVKLSSGRTVALSVENIFPHSACFGTIFDNNKL